MHQHVLWKWFFVAAIFMDRGFPAAMERLKAHEEQSKTGTARGLWEA
jgi:hypothetical protein